MFFLKEIANKNFTRQKLAHHVNHQLMIVFVHTINLISNLLGNDFLSCLCRQFLLSLLGIQLGKGTVIRGSSYFGGGGLTTGSDCQINRSCYFDFTASITFGNNVVVGHEVTFITTDHEIGDSICRAGRVIGNPISVEDGVWICAKSTILPGVTIGKGSVIAAGAVVAKNVLPNVLVAGVPAKFIKSLPI